jgi:hypothetical protein
MSFAVCIGCLPFDEQTLPHVFHACNSKNVSCAKHFAVYGVRMKKHMTLDQWCQIDGRGPSAQAKALGISRATLWRLRGGDHPILPDTAKRVELATGGKVKAATLLGIEA